MTTVAFVLVSWRPDAPAGMERAVAAHAAGLIAAGHQAVIITAERAAPAGYAGAIVRVLESLAIANPCDDDELRAAIATAGNTLTKELQRIYVELHVDTAVYVDALWGLGRAMPTGGRARPVLAVHVVGHDVDLPAALPRTDLVIAPSEVVLRTAAERGYDTSGWQVVPNALLLDKRPASPVRRRHLQQHGPIRVLARLGAEKGVAQLLAAAVGAQFARPVQIALSAAGFQAAAGQQGLLLGLCRSLAERCGAQVVAGLPWAEVPGWLTGASVVLVPSLRETFGLVALEAMAGGTPVVAFDVDNLPTLIGPGGVIVAQADGHAGLWRAARRLLDDPVLYEQTSRAGYTRSRDYRPAQIADLLVKVVN